MSEKPKAAIFDLDGTMMDNHQYHEMACIELCKKYGLSLTKTEFTERYIGWTTRQFVKELFGNISNEKINAYEDEKEAIYRELYKGSVCPIDGLIDLIQDLKDAGFLLGVATSAPVQNLQFSLDGLGITDKFDSLMCLNDITNAKPHPEIYSRSIGNLNVEAERAVVFEDSKPGILSALSAGAKVVAITTSQAPDELEDVHLIIEDYTSITSLTINGLLA